MDVFLVGGSETLETFLATFFFKVVISRLIVMLFLQKTEKSEKYPAQNIAIQNAGEKWEALSDSKFSQRPNH